IFYSETLLFCSKDFARYGTSRRKHSKGTLLLGGHPSLLATEQLRELDNSGKQIWKLWGVAKRADVAPTRFLSDQFHLRGPGKRGKQRHLVLAAEVGPSTDCKRSG